MALTHQWVRQMTPKDKRFYQGLGQRLATFRKAQGLTQQQLAEMMDISQQTMAHYEVGRLRVAVAMLPELAKVLGIAVEELIGTPSTASKNKRGPAPRLQQQIELIQQLPRTKQRFVMEMLDTVLQQAS